MKTTFLLGMALLILGGAAGAGDEVHFALNTPDMQWADLPGLAGVKIAVLDGKLSEPGPFTFRLKLPAGYRSAPHWHPAFENGTVLAGSISLGMGKEFDPGKLTDMRTGGFWVMPAQTPHFARTEEGAIIQLHGIGPWGLTYVNPADDPRTAR